MTDYNSITKSCGDSPYLNYLAKVCEPLPALEAPNKNEIQHSAPVVKDDHPFFSSLGLKRFGSSPWGEENTQQAGFHLLFLALVALVAGCLPSVEHIGDPWPADGGRPDGDGPEPERWDAQYDGIDLDGSPDGMSDAKPDVSVMDASPDVSVADAAPDVSVMDATPDVSVADVSTDVAVTDANPDVEVFDASPDVLVADASPDVISPDAGPPEPPTLLHPAEGALLPPMDLSDPTKGYAYLAAQNGFIPPGLEVSHYVFCLTNEGLPAIEGVVCPNPVISANRYLLIGPMSANATYFWKLKTCFDEAETNCTPYSAIGTFSSGDETMFPYAEWKFNGNLNDSGPNGLDGQAPINPGFAGPTFVANGGVCDGEIVSGLLDGDMAACFDDSDGAYDYVRLTPHIDSLDFGSSDDYAVEARFIRNTGEGNVTLFHMEHAATPAPVDPGFSISLTSEDNSPEYRNRIFTELVDNVPETGDSGGDGVGLYSTEEFALGSFNHSVIIYDGQPREELDGVNIAQSTLTLYSQGILQDSGDSDYDFAAEDFEFLTLHAIAGCPETCSLSGNVLIDSISIYHRALSSEEIINNLCVREVLAGGIEATLPSACF